MKDGDINIKTNINKMDELMGMRGELMAPNARQISDGGSEQLARHIHDDVEINDEEEERVIGMDLNLDPKALIDVLTKDFGG